MVRLRIQDKFTLKDYAKVYAIKKQSKQEDEFIAGDIIECDNNMAKYLDGDNPLHTSFVKIIEVIPDEVEAKEVETKEEPTKKVVKKRKKKLDK